ncbi:MAG TPA: TraR/DksA family transcriptional regulator [Candidatus Hypogeohydataceae bacterium YC41]
MPIQKRTLKDLEARLFTRRNRLLREIHRRLQEYKESGGSRLPDIVDLASSTVGDELTLQAAETEVRELRQIEDAIARIHSGRYGICKHCGNTIPINRLKALPFATLCVKCKEAEEEEESRMVERLGRAIPLEEGTETEEGEEPNVVEELDREFSTN